MAPPVGRGIEGPGSTKTHHPVKGDPWTTAIQPRSGRVGELDHPWGAPWGYKGDRIPSLIRPRQLLGKKVSQTPSIQPVQIGTHKVAALASFQLVAYYF